MAGENAIHTGASNNEDRKTGPRGLYTADYTPKTRPNEMLAERTPIRVVHRVTPHFTPDSPNKPMEHAAVHAKTAELPRQPPVKSHEKSDVLGGLIAIAVRAACGGHSGRRLREFIGCLGP